MKGGPQGPCAVSEMMVMPPMMVVVMPVMMVAPHVMMVMPAVLHLDRGVRRAGSTR
ncbi:hypothetical protein MOX02_60790 [Methylobacterium oxalidis]|uniref:Uncharacterized protein n=1 Tax=Methylobacterium oxalidis TaxID=944322 RepID=A0A512JDL9_9HYPH|nr:hypothetical protein MOX02_60790 [Methylobacterium oxalidis]GLS63832.1 hypothetical protein GCM10007888_22130 [Methylobacterium oxalidis]